MTFRRVAFPSLLLLGLAGCGMTPGGSELDMSTTGSISKASPSAAPGAATDETMLSYAPAQPKVKSVIDGVAPADWERVRIFASTNLDQTPDGKVLDWTNASTGSNGTITPLAASRPESGGRQCRAFSLTISDVRGIRGYRGDACRAPDGMWQLFDLTAEDRALL